MSSAWPPATPTVGYPTDVEFDARQKTTDRFEAGFERIVETWCSQFDPPAAELVSKLEAR
jgi:hypothetical protein